MVVWGAEMGIIIPRTQWSAAQLPSICFSVHGTTHLLRRLGWTQIFPYLRNKQEQKNQSNEGAQQELLEVVEARGQVNGEHEEAHAV